MKNNKYCQVPDMTLDLHGHTANEATHLLDTLCVNNKGMLVRIIVGKGTRSKSGPVLPDHVKRYLTAANIPYRQSKIQEGGEGSLEAQF